MPPGRMARKQGFGVGVKGFRLGAGGFYHPLKHLVWLKVHVGKHTKHKAVDEMCHGFGVMPPAAQALGKGGKALCFSTDAL